MHLLCSSNIFWKAPSKSSCVSVSMIFVTAFSSHQLSHNDSLWVKGITKSHREQGLDYRDREELSWCPSWSNSLWQGWSCGLVHCPGEKCHWADWKSAGLFRRNLLLNSLKPQHSNPNPNLLANQLWCSDFLTPPTPLIILTDTLPCLNLLCHSKNRCSIYARCSKSSLKHSIHFCGIFSKFKTEFYCISFFSSPDCIFEIHQLRQSAISRVYSNCCCSCWFEPEIIKMVHSSHDIYSNYILNFQESTAILNAHTKKVWKLNICTSYIPQPIFANSLDYEIMPLKWLLWSGHVSFSCSLSLLLHAT